MTASFQPDPENPAAVGREEPAAQLLPTPEVHHAHRTPARDRSPAKPVQPVRRGWDPYGAVQIQDLPGVDSVWVYGRQTSAPAARDPRAGGDQSQALLRVQSPPARRSWSTTCAQPSHRARSRPRLPDHQEVSRGPAVTPHAALALAQVRAQRGPCASSRRPSPLQARSATRRRLTSAHSRSGCRSWRRSPPTATSTPGRPARSGPPHGRAGWTPHR